MEEKKIFKRHSSLRAVSSFWSISESFFRKLSFPKFTNSSWSIANKKFSQGFTLIELLVVFCMVGVLVSFLLLFINPVKQIQKARDAQRQQNLKQVESALNLYYNDNSRFPSSLAFDVIWQGPGGAIYMKKVPQDPDCASAGLGSCYNYLTDPSNSQWNILFAKLYNTQSSSVTCSLPSSCVPTNYQSLGYNYCVVSGKVDCSFISTHALPAIDPNATNPTSTPVANPTYTPTPTSSQGPSGTPPLTCSNFYALTGSGSVCNDLGSDPLNQCSIHGGSYTCYSDRFCLGALCQ